MTSKELAKIAYNALDDKKGVNISILIFPRFQPLRIILSLPAVITKIR